MSLKWVSLTTMTRLNFVNGVNRNFANYVNYFWRSKKFTSLSSSANGPIGPSKDCSVTTKWQKGDKRTTFWNGFRNPVDLLVLVSFWIVQKVFKPVFLSLPEQSLAKPIRPYETVNGARSAQNHMASLLSYFGIAQRRRFIRTETLFCIH